MEVPEAYNVSQAHETVEKVEVQMRKEIPNLGEILIHIEPKGDQESRHQVDYAESERINEILKELPKSFPLVSECHNLVTYRENDQLSLTFHCYFSPEIKITEAHKLTTAMEQFLRKQIPELDRVYIHAEPLEK
jgi:divalent metal cation (Fe/Co/Zn/Cd) transporter